jgi:hypothetical protein
MRLNAGMTFAELAIKEFPPQRWVVRGLVPVGLTLLTGKAKIGKSWLALGFSIAVANGTAALGAKCERGDVLHLALEDMPRRFKDRMHKILADAEAPDQANVYFRWERVEKGGLTSMESWLASHPDARLIVIDTLALMRPRRAQGGNQYLGDYDDIRALKKIADKFNVGIVVVHHLRKAGAIDPVDEVSGTMGLSGAADSLLILKRPRKENRGTLVITGRDVAERELAVQFDPGAGTWTVLGEAHEVNMSDARRDIIGALKKLGRPAKPREVAEALGKDRGAVKKLMLDMRYDGGLVQKQEGTYELAAPKKNPPPKLKFKEPS